MIKKQYLKKMNEEYIKKGNLDKLEELECPCLSREHNPPSHMVLKPGKYKWTCPSCGKEQIFYVQGFMWGIKNFFGDWRRNVPPGIP